VPYKIAGGVDLWRERMIEKKEEERKKKESGSNQYRHKDTSLVDGLLCHKGDIKVGAPPIDVAGSLVQLNL
jgi:hypothetical protein